MNDQQYFLTTSLSYRLRAAQQELSSFRSGDAYVKLRTDYEGIKIIQGKLEHNKKRFPIPGAFLQHVFGDLIPLICCEAVKII